MASCVSSAAVSTSSGSRWATALQLALRFPSRSPEPVVAGVVIVVVVVVAVVLVIIVVVVVAIVVV